MQKWGIHMRVSDAGMKIDQNVDVEKIAYSHPQTKETARMADSKAGYQIDISGTVKDNAAYGKEDLKSSKDIARDAEQTDVALQRDYMAVMSNSMSAEDFAKLTEEGCHPLDTRVEEQVTSLDKIKATMLEAGVVIEGYTDDLSKEQLEKITGSSARAMEITQALINEDVPVTEENVQKVTDALDQLTKIAKLSDEAKKYLLNQEQTPDIEHLYKAQFVSQIASYERAYSQIDFSKIKDQVVNIIEKAGLEADEQTLENAQWALMHQVPITEKTLQIMDELQQLTFPIDEKKAIAAIAVGMSDGLNPQNARLNETRSIVKKSKDALETIETVSLDDLRNVIGKKEDLTIRNLRKELMNQENQQNQPKQPSENEFLHAKRILEEARLVMSLEANAKLLRQGISIDTTNLEKLVDELKLAEEQIFRPLLGNETPDGKLTNKIALYKETEAALYAVKEQPLEAFANLYDSYEDFTLRKIHEEGLRQKQAYEQANDSYEAMMTKPRADLGDSIKKAFRNVDDLLNELHLEVTEMNRKTLRVMGYSGIEMTETNVKEVKDALYAVTNVLDKMTPQKVLQMIRDGENPLDTNLYELSAQLSEQKPEEEAEKYSKFLWNLEKNHEISEQEKSAFIGLFRLFRQIEKSDGKLIGDVVRNAEDLTLKKLLSASRSNRAAGMDVRIEGSFGTLQELIKTGDSILEQIQAGFSKEYVKAFEKNAYETEPSYIKELQQDIAKAMTVTDPVIESLLDSDQAVTFHNLLAADELLNAKGMTFSKVFSKLNESKSLQAEKMAKNVVEHFTGKEEAVEAYQEMTEQMSEELLEDAMEQEQYLDVKERMLLCKQLSVASSFAGEENYEVPIRIDDKWTSINLKVIRNGSEEGSVVAIMETAKLGKVAAKLHVEGKEVSGYFTSSEEASVNQLKLLQGEFEAAFSKQGRSVKSLDFIKADKLDLLTFSKENSEKSQTGMNDLYEVAKALVTTIQKLK